MIKAPSGKSNPAPLPDWDDLVHELSLWHDAGKTAQFWWRDDDAVAPTASLDRLAETSNGAPISLAAIPNGATRALVDWVRSHGNFRLSQHGLTHENHAPAGEKKSEFGPNRPLDVALGDIRTGWEKLSDLTGGVGLDPLFVPPWNRISAEIAGQLPSLGPRVLSVFTPRTPDQRGHRLNTHADPVNWKHRDSFLGVGPALAPILQHLRAKRIADQPRIDAAEPTGLLTHHLRHDAATWAFLRTFGTIIADHPGAKWTSVSREIAS